MKKYLIVSLICFKLLGQAPSLSTGVKDVPYFVPNLTQTFASACTTAASKGLTLLIGRSFNVSAGTYTCYINASKGGKLVLTGTVIVNSLECTQYAQCIDGTSGTISFVSTSPNTSPIWWGADPSFVNDSAFALNACIVAGTTCKLPPGGHYNTKSKVVMSGAGKTFHCDNQSTVITYTGTGTDAVFQVGDGLAGSNTNVFEGCAVFGNIHITKAAVFLYRSDFTNLHSLTFGDAPTGMLLWNSNTIIVDSPKCANQTTSGFLTKCVALGGAAAGVILDPPGTFAMNQVWFRNVRFNGPGDALYGVYIDGATGTPSKYSAGIHFNDGSINGIGTAIGTTGGCLGITFHNFDIEIGVASAPASALTSNCSKVSISGLNFWVGDVHLLGASYDFSMRDTLLAGTVLIDSGAKDINLANVEMDTADGPNGGTIYVTDNSGTNTLDVSKIDYIGGGIQEDFVKGVYNKGGCINCITSETGATNAIVGTFSFAHAVITPFLFDGLTVNVTLGHKLTGLVGNTFNFAGTGVKNIFGGSGTYQNLLYTYAVGQMVTLRYYAGVPGWILVSDPGVNTSTTTPTYIVSDLAGGANNALVVTVVDAYGTNVPIFAGMHIFVRLTHSLQIGANTMNVNGQGALPIQVGPAASNLSVAWIGSGYYAEFVNYGTNVAWQCINCR